MNKDLNLRIARKRREMRADRAWNQISQQFENLIGYKADPNIYIGREQVKADNAPIAHEVKRWWN